MKPQITIINRSGRGSRKTFTQATISFGREADNVLVIAGKHASRKHGELRFDDEHWSLVNLSTNGTEVNDRRVRDKPCPLNDRDVISVGGEPILELRIVSAVALPSAAPSADPIEPRPGISRRAKLWVGIGIYLILFTGFFLFLNTLTKNKEAGQYVTPLTAEQIEAEIRKPLAKMPEDLRQSEIKLHRARELITSLDSAPDTPYKCYMAYKTALALAGREHFDPGMDQLNFQGVRVQLTTQVADTYNEAFGNLKGQRFAAATEAFRKLDLIYPDTKSLIHASANALKSRAADDLKQRRRRRR
jgi:pSer/pThr/pTyr-binding forkhead associated (FHA) protein